MTHYLEAIYENGVFKPFGPVCLTDQTRVHLVVESPTVVASGEREVARQRQAMVDLDAELEHIDDASPDDGLTSADHDQVVYGKPA